MDMKIPDIQFHTVDDSGIYLKVPTHGPLPRRGSGNFPAIKKIFSGLRQHKSSDDIRLGSKNKNNGLTVSLGGEDGSIPRGGVVETPVSRGLRGAYAARSAELLAPPNHSPSNQSAFTTPHRYNISRSLCVVPDRATMRRSSLPASSLSRPPHYPIVQAERKKSVADTKSAHRKKAGVPRSPLVAKRAVGETGSSGGAPSLASTSSSSRLRHVNTSDSALSAGQAEGGTSDSEMADMSTLSNTVTSTSNGGSLSDAALEDMLDSHDGHTIDPQRTKAAIHHLQAKIHRTMEMISAEQAAKEENVNEYLRLSANADKQQQQRIKTVFEKRNQKSTQSIAQLQRKLEGYQKRLKEVETYGVSGHKQAKEVLRDVGQGLKVFFSRETSRETSPPPRGDVGANIRDGIIGFPGGVVDNIRGAKDTIVSKPKEFAHLIKNKFGSADNINSLRQLEESQGSTDDGEKRSQHGSGTLPASFKYQSDDEASSITSGSGPSGAHSSPRPQSGSGPGTSSQPLATHLPEPPRVDIEPILLELQENREAQKQLKETIESLKTQMQSDIAFFKQALEEESSHAERLEMQINDLTELHQHEVTNIKQELSSMEEKMEYQLEERTRDMQELLETCQTRITKMELQQQQQQLISMEGIENSNFRALLTKLINVVLALLAVVLVFVSTVANLLGPFLTTRLRILSTICLVAAIVATWQHWSLVRDLGSHVMQQYRHVFPAQ